MTYNVFGGTFKPYSISQSINLKLYDVLHVGNRFVLVKFM